MYKANLTILMGLMFSLTPFIQAATYGGGSGTAGDPYQIRTPEQMNTIGANPSDWWKDFKLMSDIDMSVYTGTQYNIIGNSSNSFRGTFDGNKHVIRNLTYKTTAAVNKVGLFGCVGCSGEGGQVRNLGLENVSISSGGRSTGGLCGGNGSKLIGCYVTGSVTGAEDVGGLVGQNDGYGSITGCYATCSVTGTSSAGGVGGIVGYNLASITACYAIGSVNGTGSSVGGLVGRGDNSPARSCFWDMQTSGQSGSASGKGLTTAQMKTLSIFQNAGWADKGWVMINGMDYPRLSWENRGGIPIPLPQAIPLAGSGTTAAPYLISTAQEFVCLSWYSGILDKQIRLTADLNLSGMALYPIGDLGPFTGMFDGNGHTISNAVINQPGSDFVGLFSYIVSGEKIRNLGVVNPIIHGRKLVGGLVGKMGYQTTITSCYVTGLITGTEKVGGLVGSNEYGTISSCYATGAVSGASSIGGLAGNNDGKITACFSTASVSGSVFYSYVGGLVGFNGRNGMVTACYATGSLNGKGCVGGLVGENDGKITACYATGAAGGSFSVGGLVGKNDDTITACYATGLVSGNPSDIGGLVGQNYSIITASFWDIQISGQMGSNGGRGLTTGQMKTLSIYRNAGWADLGWVMDEGVDYPRLSWENRNGVPIPLPQPIPLSGSGTAEDPYRISTPQEFALLSWYSGILNKQIELTANLDLSEMTLYSIGDLGHFTGVFDGKGYSISNAVLYQPSDYTGLFGYVGSGGQIKNLGVINVNITGRNCVGGLVGWVDSGIITSCYATGSVCGSFNVGGLVGAISQSSIRSCHGTASVTGNNSVGGLAGASSGTILSCYAAGSISGSDVGGLVGINKGTITASYATDSVSGASQVGGLVGCNYGTITSCYSTSFLSGSYNTGGLVGYQGGSSSRIEYCYSIGSVIGGENSGGFLGCLYAGTIFESLWDTQTSGLADGVGTPNPDPSGVTGQTTEQMKILSTFTQAGWDFTTTWTICERTNYPRFSWQIPAGDFFCPDDVNTEDLDYFAGRWLLNNCTSANNYCDGTDLDNSGVVNLADFAKFAAQWLNGVEKISSDMANIPGGTFSMGNSFNEGYPDARPVHTVTLSEFEMAKYEVNNAQYCDFLNSSLRDGTIYVEDNIVWGTDNDQGYCTTFPSSSDVYFTQIAYVDGGFYVRTKGGRDMSEDPMVELGWYGAVAYCNWRSQQEGRETCYDLTTWACDFSKNGYRLPTEAEWEYAARGRLSGRRFPWGDTISHTQANYYSEDGHTYDNSPTRGYHPIWDDGIYPYTSPVGSFPPNGYGLYDMAGNAWEWCNDGYSETYYSVSPQMNPLGPSIYTGYVRRGGSWRNGAGDCRVSFRGYNEPYHTSGTFGFRICRNRKP